MVFRFTHWLSHLVYPPRKRTRSESRKLRKKLKRHLGREKSKNTTIKRLLILIDHLLVLAVRSGAADQLETLVNKLTDQEVARVNKVRIMGLSRLFLAKGRTKAAESLLSRYILTTRSDQLLYFLEPLVELDRAGALGIGPLREFCAKFQPPSSMLALDWLRTEYKAADDTDHRNFERFIIEPLYALTKNERNLMDIRFSSQQRSALQEIFKSNVIAQRPLSLLRLGDGEAYPYPVPQVEGIEPFFFENDIRNFELSNWGVPPPEHVREDVITRFRQAVARCDVLGFPSVYRIIRNLTRPYSRYGERRNQRAFIRILSALGNAIPVGQKLFTEERCHRIRGAIDEPFLIELANMARSVVLVSNWPEIKSKFPLASSVILVPSSGIELFKIYPEIIGRVREASGPGTIVFVGAGILGKILADEARQSGAVALDVGSLMDYMVGHKTRTIADLI